MENMKETLYIIYSKIKPEVGILCKYERETEIKYRILTETEYRQFKIMFGYIKGIMDGSPFLYGYNIYDVLELFGFNELGFDDIFCYCEDVDIDFRDFYIEKKNPNIMVGRDEVSFIMYKEMDYEELHLLLTKD